MLKSLLWMVRLPLLTKIRFYWHASKSASEKIATGSGSAARPATTAAPSSSGSAAQPAATAAPAAVAVLRGVVIVLLLQNSWASQPCTVFHSGWPRTTSLGAPAQKHSASEKQLPCCRALNPDRRICNHWNRTSRWHRSKTKNGDRWQM